MRPVAWEVKDQCHQEYCIKHGTSLDGVQCVVESVSCINCVKLKGSNKISNQPLSLANGSYRLPLCYAVLCDSNMVHVIIYSICS